MRRTLSCLLCLATIVAAAHPCQADPDRVTIQSALVWRTDGTGDYLLPKLQPDTTYQIAEGIPTAGQIESITAAWSFQGEVELEVSADGGLHYSPVVYGVPLTTLVKGNRLKWRATLGEGSQLHEVAVSYQDNSKVLGAFGDPRLSGFTHRKPLIVNGSDSGTTYQYQLAVAIGESAETAAYDLHCEGRVRGDFADLRFTSSDGQTVLPHYLETVVGMSPARLAVVWVRIPQVPAEGITLYLYYGNAGAPALSDGKAVFDFFDDFAGSKLDANLWTTDLKGGSVRVADGKLQLTAASALAKSFRLADGIVEYLATTKTAQDDARLIIRNDPEAKHPDETNQMVYASAYGGAEHVIAVGGTVQVNNPKPIVPGEPYGYQVITRGTEMAFQRFDPEFIDVQAMVSFDDGGGLTEGILGVHSEGNASYDWIRVRRFAQPPPAVSEATGEAPEEAANLPTFMDAKLAPNGNVMPVDPKRPGIYETAKIGSDFSVRTIMPEWQGQAASMAVSANGGASYRRECLLGAHYYASKGHFLAGKQLMAELTIEGSEDVPKPELASVSLDYTAGGLFVVSPNGGEELDAGTTYPITWSALGHDAAYPVRLEYSLDAGKTYKLISDATENDGNHIWALPDDAESEDVLVRISDRHDAEIFDESDETLTIALMGGAGGSNKKTRLKESGTDDSEAAFSDDLMSLLEELSQDEEAMLHDIVIKVTDSEGPLSYKAGDIVLIRPAGSEWSEAEKNNFLIIQANLPPNTVAMLLRPLEEPTGEIDRDGRPVMRTLGRRKFKIDLSYFDLKIKPSDKGKPAVLRHFKKPQDLKLLVEDRTEPNPAPLVK